MCTPTDVDLSLRGELDITVGTFQIKSCFFLIETFLDFKQMLHELCPRKTSGLPWLTCWTLMGFIVRRFGRQMVCGEVARARARAQLCV